MSGPERLVVISWHRGPGSKVLSSLLMSELKMKLIKAMQEGWKRMQIMFIPYFILRIMALNYTTHLAIHMVPWSSNEFQQIGQAEWSPH